MASKRHQRRIKEQEQRKQCGSKLQYNAFDAKAVAKRLTRKEGWLITAYQCRHCGSWHVGHTPLRDRRG